MEPVKRVHSLSKHRMKFGSSTSTSNGPLTNFPVIKHAELLEIAPRYTTVLSRSLEEGVTMEDLDQLELDLERLLSASAVRHRLLRSYVHKPYDDVHIKKKRMEEKPKHKDVRHVGRILKTKHIAPNNLNISEIPIKEEVIIPKDPVTDRFWLSVEPYCQEVSRDNVCFLDELLKECSKQIDVTIPELGEDYANEWADAALQQEQLHGTTKIVRKEAVVNLSNEIKKNGISKEIETFQGQRIFDEQLNEKMMKTFPGVFEKLKNNEFPFKSNNGFKSGLCLEKRLRKELMEQGIFDVEDDPKANQQEDEVLMEIKRCHQELSVINKHNIEELNKLRDIVTKDFVRQDIKDALDKIDNQIMNVYNDLLYPTPNIDMSKLKQDASNAIKQQVRLHRELAELTDFTLLE